MWIFLQSLFCWLGFTWRSSIESKRRAVQDLWTWGMLGEIQNRRTVENLTNKTQFSEGGKTKVTFFEVYDNCTKIQDLPAFLPVLFFFSHCRTIVRLSVKTSLINSQSRETLYPTKPANILIGNVASSSTLFSKNTQHILVFPVIPPSISVMILPSI